VVLFSRLNSQFVVLNVLSLEKQLAGIATGFAKDFLKDCFRWQAGFLEGELKNDYLHFG
jgi:hypothetical protein|tara:strand:+ start:179 stop:355 length:177 start_codon:yes stop_codon:yes gene_type:complete